MRATPCRKYGANQVCADDAKDCGELPCGPTCCEQPCAGHSTYPDGSYCDGCESDYDSTCAACSEEKTGLQ